MKKEKKKVVDGKTKEKEKGKAVEKVRSEWEDMEDREGEWVDEVLERIRKLERNLWAKVHAGFEKTQANIKNIVDLIDPEWSEYLAEDGGAELETEVSDLEEFSGELELEGIREEVEMRKDQREVEFLVK